MIDVHVRGINADIWRAMRAEAVTRDISVAKLIEGLFIEHGNFAPYVRNADREYAFIEDDMLVKERRKPARRVR